MITESIRKKVDVLVTEAIDEATKIEANWLARLTTLKQEAAVLGDEFDNANDDYLCGMADSIVATLDKAIEILTVEAAEYEEDAEDLADEDKGGI